MCARLHTHTQSARHVGAFACRGDCVCVRIIRTHYVPVRQCARIMCKSAHEIHTAAAGRDVDIVTRVKTVEHQQRSSRRQCNLLVAGCVSAPASRYCGAHTCYHTHTHTHKRLHHIARISHELLLYTCAHCLRCALYQFTTLGVKFVVSFELLPAEKCT